MPAETLYEGPAYEATFFLPSAGFCTIGFQRPARLGVHTVSRWGYDEATSVANEPKNNPRTEGTMAIVDDYTAIAAELRRPKAKRRPEATATAEQQNVRPILPDQHPMRRTAVGELLYRRLLSRRRR